MPELIQITFCTLNSWVDIVIICSGIATWFTRDDGANFRFSHWLCLWLL